MEGVRRGSDQDDPVVGDHEPRQRAHSNYRLVYPPEYEDWSESVTYQISSYVYVNTHYLNGIFGCLEEYWVKNHYTHIIY